MYHAYKPSSAIVYRDLLQVACQFYQRFATCQTIATKLSTSSSVKKSVKIRIVETGHLQTCYNSLKQLAASVSIAILIGYNLQQTCRQQAVASHAWERLISARCQQIFCNLRVFSSPTCLLTYAYLMYFSSFRVSRI